MTLQLSIRQQNPEVQHRYFQSRPLETMMSRLNPALLTRPVSLQSVLTLSLHTLGISGGITLFPRHSSVWLSSLLHPNYPSMTITRVLRHVVSRVDNYVILLKSKHIPQNFVMRSLHDVHNMNSRARYVSPSVRMIQPENRWTDLDEISYKRYAIGVYFESCFSVS